MPRFLTSLQEKAQSALDRSGFAAHLPPTHTTQAQQPLNPNNPASTSAQEPDVADGKTSRPLIDSLTHQFRALHAQYAPQGPPEMRKLQVLITNAKGVALDYDGVGRDVKALSKDFYLWGQEQDEDVKDVSDRLAYLNFVHGILASTLATKLETARAPLKELRRCEAALGPRRAQREQLQGQIQRFRAEGGRTNPAETERKIAELEGTLSKHNEDDSALEKELAIWKRKAIGDSEKLKWEAMREYGEKLVLLSQASTQLIGQLPSTPPSLNKPYTGQQNTAATRSSVQIALDQWKPGMITLSPLQANYVADTRSFGESHASELSRVNSVASGLPDMTHGAPSTSKPGYVSPHEHLQQPVTSPHPGGLQPPSGPASSYYSSPSTATPHQTSTKGYAAPTGPPPGHKGATFGAQPGSPTINPATLNNTPAPIPITPHQPGTAGSNQTTKISLPSTISPVVARQEAPVSAALAMSESTIGSTDPTLTSPTGPTVAETGVPIGAGPTGLGPATGSLSRDAVPHAHFDGGVPAYGAGESGIPGYTPGGFKHDVGGEDEKKRLEREERERFLAQSVATGSGNAPSEQKLESAEEEKKRLEKEERERLFRSGTIRKDGDGGPPPYA